MVKTFKSYKIFLMMVIGVQALFFLLSGCATMKKDECLTVSWYEMGFEDGIKGYATSRIAKHRKACAKYGITADLDQYLKGHAKGVLQYCTGHQGYLQGLSGRQFNEICRGSAGQEFLQGYDTGRKIYLFEREIEDEKHEIKSFEREILDIESSLKQMKSALAEDCRNPAKCDETLHEIQRLENRKSRLERKIRSKETGIEMMNNTLYDMKAGSGYN